MNQEDITIRRGIVHILEGELGYPVYSEEELEIGTKVEEFFQTHLCKLLSGDDLKKCYFSQEEPSEVYELVKGFREEELVPASKKLAELLYRIMNANIAIPDGDLAVLTFSVQGAMYLALLKLNYKESYVHMTGTAEGGNVNQIICYQSTLPAAGVKLSEAVLINLADYSVQIVEKKYDINGVKVNYLSEQFLHCHAQMSSKSRLAIVTKAVEQVNKKHYADEPVKQLEAKSIMKKEIQESGSLNVERISEKIYGDTPEIKEEFDAKMEKYHMGKAEVTPKSQATTKRLEKQYLKTDTGIEINIPMEQYQDASQVEFITNPDGTISVLIKNINRISTR